MKGKIVIDGFEQVIKYQSPESERKGRIKSTELLGNGGRHFHVPGLSNDYTVKFESYIKQDDVNQLSHFDNVVYNNSKVNLLSTFNNIKSGYYYLDSFNPKYDNAAFYSVSWSLNLITNQDTLSDVYGSTNNNKVLSTSDSLNSDSTSFASTTTTLTPNNTNKTQVKQIQTLLKSAGFYVSIGRSSLNIDGVWGKYTTQSIQQFQKSKGLTITGTITDETKKSLGF